MQGVWRLSLIKLCQTAIPTGVAIEEAKKIESTSHLPVDSDLQVCIDAPLLCCLGRAAIIAWQSGWRIGLRRFGTRLAAAIAARRLGLTKELPPLRTDLFEVPLAKGGQLALF